MADGSFTSPVKLMSNEQVVIADQFCMSGLCIRQSFHLLSLCVVCLQRLPACMQSLSVLFSLIVQCSGATERQKTLMLGCRQRRRYEVGECAGGTGAAGEG